MNLENAIAEILVLLASRNEWLLIHSSGNAFALQRDEIEITFERGKIILNFLDEKGFQIWRIANYKIAQERLTLDLTRNFGREREKIKLVPRLSAEESGAAVELARLEKANQLAGLIVAENPQSKLVRVALNKENGRFAQIIFETARKNQIAVLADVAESATPENLLTAAILWFSKLQRRRKNSIDTVWIPAEKKLYKNLRKLHALLRENWQRNILIKEIRRDIKTQRREIKDAPAIAFENLWREKPLKIAPLSFETSRTANEIIKLAPGKIDFIYTKHGETLRFLGLPFARVRKIGDAERFGSAPNAGGGF